MQKNRKWFIWSGLVVLGLFGLGGGLWVTVFGQVHEAVRLELEVAPGPFQVGEPLSVRVGLVNEGQEAVHFARPSLLTQTMRYWVRSINGEREEIELGIVVEPSGLPETLEAGATYDSAHYSTQLIHYNSLSNDLVFPQPGSYTLEAEFVGFISIERRPEVAEVAIEVVSNPLADAAGAELFSQLTTASFITGFYRDAEVIQSIENLIATQPDSVFSDYGRYYLALHTVLTFPDQSPDFRGAIALMTPVADRSGFQLQADALLKLGEWYWQLGDAVQAYAMFDRAIQEYPDSDVAEAASDLRGKYDNLPVPPTPEPENVAIEGELRAALVAAVNQYLDAVQRSDLEGALATMDDTFLYNEVIDKDGMTKVLGETFVELQNLEGVFSIGREFTQLELVEETPVVDVTLSYSLDDKLLLSDRLVQIGMVQRQADWLLQSWRRLN